MKKLFSLSHVKKYIPMGSMFVALLLCSGKTAYPQSQSNDTVERTQQQITGTWVSTEGGSSKWVFTDSTTKIYYDNEPDGAYSYTISRSPTHCGYDVSDRLQRYPEESILTLTNSQTNEKECYYVYDITENHLSLSPFGYATFLSFDKQQ